MLGDLIEIKSRIHWGLRTATTLREVRIEAYFRLLSKIVSLSRSLAKADFILRHSLALLIVLVGCAGCAETVEPVPFKAVTNTQQLMEWILDPNADVIWGAAGAIITEEGTQDLAPTTPEGWDAVRNAAATLAEGGNLLMMPGHARPDDWMEIAQGMTATAELLIDAAERKDSEAVFNYGGQLYNVCVACHQLYMLPGE